MGVSGSIRKVLIGGISFNAAADGSPARMPEAEIEGIRHTGGVEKKITLANGAVESLKIICDDTNYEILKGFMLGIENVPMSYEKADGTVLRATGFIALDNHESADNNVDVTMTPETGRWEVFAA